MSTKCTCEANMDGKCTHVAALFYLIEDITSKTTPRMTRPCTSRPQDFKKGARTGKNPKPLHLAKYEKKILPDQYIGIDPRPEHLRRTTIEEVNYFHISLSTLKKEPMWLHTFRVVYEKYDVSPDRKVMLRTLGELFLENLKRDIQKYNWDPLSTPFGVHITGTMLQAASDIWFRERSIRVTASSLVDFIKNPAEMIYKRLWNNQQDLSNVPAIKWGREHEADAREQYESSYGATMSCGLFASREFPFIGASPDAIQDDLVIEIKCPFTLRKVLPTNLEILTPAQRGAHFNEKVNGVMKLKRSHKYFVQVQCQLFVTGCKMARFVT
jgi:hypothetical protein